MRGTPDERFWAKVRKTEDCWLWTASVSAQGYGYFRMAGKMMQAHRAAWLLAGRDLPPHPLYLDHACSNPSCVRVDHLRVASNKQNQEHRTGAQRNNRSSGVRGVTRHVASCRWHVRVIHNKRVHSGGLYDDLEDAAHAAQELRNRLFTHNDVDREGQPFA